VRLDEPAPTPTAKNTEVRTTTAVAETGEIKDTSNSWRKILARCGTSFALVAAIFSLIFVFTIGFTLKGSPNFEEAWNQLGVSNVEDISIYDFFGKNYEDIQLLLNNRYTGTGNAAISNIDHWATALYLTAVLNTIIAAATLIAVTALSITAIVNTAQKLSGKNVKHAESFAFAAFMTFVIGVVALLALNLVTANARNVSTSSSSQPVNMSAAVTFNDATMAGLVLGAIFAGLSLACYVASRKIRTPISQFVLNLVFTLAGAVLVTITLNFAYNTAFINKYAYNYNSTTIGLPAAALTQIWGMKIGITLDTIDETFALLCATEIIQIALVIVAGITLIKFVIGMFNGKFGANLGCSIATTALAITYLALTLTSIDKLTEGQTGKNEKILATYAIVALVFAVLTLASVIAKMIVNETKKQPAPTADAHSAEQAL